ncbi:predicted protein [Fibroporia radiculosa]|uniref:Uncharacterized protein n=1 Tax=Fibroporia radiculosa TaxID=599839 RepID=J7RWA0_9APHY|nr:predicted protein [Fibroporia radiculosa]
MIEMECDVKHIK